MKVSMRRLMALAMAGTMTLMAGCSQASSSATGSSDTQSASGESGAEKTASGDKTVIEYWHCNAETQGGLVVDDLVKKFNEENDHIEVVAKYNPDMYKGLMQNLQAEAATGNTPALVQIGWAFLDYFSNNFDYVAPQDAIDKFDSEDANFLTDNFLPNVLDLAVNSNGEQVGVPYSLSSPVLYINKDLLKEAGADMLTADASGKKKASFATEDGIAAMQMMQDMVKDGSALHVSWEEGCQSFIDGNCAMLYTTIARRASVQKGAQFDVATVKSPLWNDKERKVPAGGCFLAITAQSDEQIQAAWEFEKYLYSVESMAAWTEGTGYVPPRKDVAEAENGLKDFLAENTMMNAAIEQMDGVVSWTAFPGDAGLEAEQLLLDMRDQILGGQVSAKDGMTSTQDAINQLLDAQ